MDESTQRLHDLFQHYAAKWQADAMEALGHLATEAIKSDAPSDREIAQRVRALGVKMRTGHRIDSLLRAHDQREREFETGARSAPAPATGPVLEELRPGDLPARDFWPDHSSSRDESGLSR